jgi:NADH-quinone oxidoreductase subunit J
LCIASNPIESAIFLILAFVNAAGILFLFHIDFLGLLLIIIYVGAIAVLFLFVIMMLNIKNEKRTELSYQAILAFSFLLLICISIYGHLLLQVFNSEDLFLYKQAEIITFIDSFSTIDMLGQVLFNYNLIAFLLAGLILLIALIGAIILTVRFHNIITGQLVHRQLSKLDNNLSFYKYNKI